MALLDRLAYPSRPRMFSCPTCTKPYFSRKYLVKHELKSNHGLSYKTCEKCKIEFATPELFQRHVTFDRCIRRRRGPYQRTPPPPCLGPLDKSRLQGNSKEFVVGNSSGITCPVGTCHRWFSLDLNRKKHVLQGHVTWGNGCLICGEKFEDYEDVFKHLGLAHGAAEEADDEVVRVKTEFILEDEVEVGLKSDIGEIGAGVVKIKQVVDQDAQIKVESESSAGVNAKVEPDQEF